MGSNSALARAWRGESFVVSESVRCNFGVGRKKSRPAGATGVRVEGPGGHGPALTGVFIRRLVSRNDGVGCKLESLDPAISSGVAGYGDPALQRKASEAMVTPPDKIQSDGCRQPGPHGAHHDRGGAFRRYSGPMLERFGALVNQHRESVGVRHPQRCLLYT